jgi:hypothetical protein
MLKYNLFLTLAFIFSSYLSNLESSGIYLPGKMDSRLRALVQKCESTALVIFEFNQKDFESNELKNTLTRIKQRSSLEGKARVESIVCLRNLNLNKEDREAIAFSIEKLFLVELQLYNNYIRWMQAGLALDAINMESFLKSRYDLMVLIQKKSIETFMEQELVDKNELVTDFSNLYLSVLRSYFDAIYNLDPPAREKFFQLKQGKKE